jgi:hypothetical protein
MKKPTRQQERITELERENEMLAMNLAIVTTNNPTPASELAAANYTAHRLLKENAMLRERLAAMPNGKS